MSLLRMSLSGAVMIVVIVIIRALAIHKLSKSAFLLLWGIAAARLLIPYSLPSSFSVYSLLERIAPASNVVTGTAAGTAQMLPTVPFVVPAYQTPLSPVVSAGTAATVPIDLWTAVWAIGALACTAFFAAAYCKCCGEFQASLPVDNESARRWLSEHRIRRAVEIRQSDRISAPLTYGVFRPVILLPKTVDWDDPDTLNYVLTHEYVHIRRFDAVTKLALTAAVCVHWFNPAVWVMYVLANRDIELSCDEAVVRRFGENTKPAYAMALIRMEEARSSLVPLCNNFSKNAIEEAVLELFERYADMVYRIALSYLRSPQEAEDVVQTVFLSLLENDTVIYDGKERAFLAKATVNRCKDLLRAAKTRDVNWSESNPIGGNGGPAAESVKEQLLSYLSELFNSRWPRRSRCTTR